MNINYKKQVRSLILNKRNNFLNPDSAKLAINQGFWQHILPLIQLKSTIAAYYPRGSELDVLSLLKNINNYDLNILLPVILEKNKIIFCPWQQGDQLTESKFAKGILEPLIKQKVEIPDIIITPLIACDLKGNRIGSGQGMYDRYINNLEKKTVCIGICYDFQLLNEVPNEPHDKKLDLILTDKRFIKFNSI
jgi:5-formyltetrahydrofolate cyclo-ligase